MTEIKYPINEDMSKEDRAFYKLGYEAGFKAFERMIYDLLNKCTQPTKNKTSGSN